MTSSRLNLEAFLELFAKAVAPLIAEQISVHLRKGLPEPSTMKAPDYYSEQDLEKRTGISRRTWQGRRQRGDGPQWVKLGSRVLYPQKTTDEFLRGPRAS